MSKVRMAPDERRAALLKSAMKLARRVGYLKVTRIAVAEDTGTTEGLINRYFGSKDGLREAIKKEAIATKDTKIIAQIAAAK